MKSHAQLCICFCVFLMKSLYFLSDPIRWLPTPLCLHHAASTGRGMAFEPGLEDWVGLHKMGGSGVWMEYTSWVKLTHRGRLGGKSFNTSKECRGCCGFLLLICAPIMAHGSRLPAPLGHLPALHFPSTGLRAKGTLG